jgi:hypothetical protein
MKTRYCALLLLICVGCAGSPEAQFDYAVSSYQQGSPVSGGQHDVDACVILKFAPMKDGNAVVLVDDGGKKSIEVWTQKALGEVMSHGRAHTERFSGRRY